MCNAILQTRAACLILTYHVEVMRSLNTILIPSHAMQNMLQSSCWFMICATNRSNAPHSDPWSQQTGEQEMELCDTCSEKKQEGLFPVTIQGFVTFMRWIPSGFWLKLSVRIVKVIMPVPASKTPFVLILDFPTFRPENLIVLRDTPATLYIEWHKKTGNF